MKKILYPFILPSALLLCIQVAVVRLNLLPSPEKSSWLSTLPWVVYGVGLVLGWRFNRSRLVLAVGLLAMVHGATWWFSRSPQGILLWDICAFLAPLNLALISLLVERGLFNGGGLVRLGLLLTEASAVVWAIEARPLQIAEGLAREYLPLAAIATPALGQTTLLAYLLAATVLAWRYWRRPNALDAAFFWAVPAVYLVFQAGMHSRDSLIHFAGAGIILLVGILESSHFMAFRDELTGLNARRALSEALLKLGSRYTIAMVDIDHFKKINDRFGHDVGDQVLRMVASKLATVSGGGRPYRYGGEEFAILFPGKSRDETLPHLERLRENIAGSPFVLRRRLRPKNRPKQPKRSKKNTATIGVTVSVGAAERQPREASDVVFKRADQALYQAKRNGRNQVRAK